MCVCMHKPLSHLLLQVVLCSGQHGHKVIQRGHEVPLDVLGLGAGQLPPAVVHLPQGGDEYIRQQLLHALQQSHPGGVQHVEVHVLRG